jgi:hypothetical protein
MSDLFREGGPHKIQKTGPDQHTFSINLPVDGDGRIARECPNSVCSPGEFKVKPGTGITTGQEIVYCPYCRGEAEPSDYTTKEQIRYAKDIAISEAHDGIHRILKSGLGLDSQGKRKLTSGGLLDVSLELKPSRKPHVRRPYAEILRRDLVCPNCTLDHSVFGLATWCSDCGCDIFSTHILGEVQVVRIILGDVPRREETLGKRIAAKDIENALEDLVSIFEAALKYEIRRYARSIGESDAKVEDRMNKIGSRLQSVRNAEQLLPTHCGVGFDGVDRSIMDQLDGLFQKRHPITHNLGVVDRKYLERIRTHEQEGKEISVTRSELLDASGLVFFLLEDFHLRLHPEATKSQQSGGLIDSSANAPDS